MNIIFLLAPFSILLALIGLAGFWWAVRNGQYDDPAGDASRILLDDAQDVPEPPL
ncbi:cbb3-type cytochrome oxidase maturation protein [Caulobacter ginsengisoli]|uniref:Cbb3-type cytochrome oxidase maturation protein n=1 Tax=Caulobacter ginsengisoli TaxID=400775 RepID=A0ABU0IVC9_9CAUL|nr:cbb3-type cytochrome oxidase assembly protein CcoS [Caulobacter ginsengisoli]MDQ0465966.1 cbb3-type cytochrome oxidase maturation protein [Caulobacter ginsengisoli]